jgi:hypothetical protein
MKLSVIVATLALATSVLALPYQHSDGMTQSNNADQAQDIKVDQNSGDVQLFINNSWVTIGSISTGNMASICASQSANQ